MPLKALHPKNMSLKSKGALFINSDREEIVPRLAGGGHRSTRLPLGVSFGSQHHCPNADVAQQTDCLFN